tara:strand:+ start:828 stop:1550 length:723 start_codon:yes stop_codon:yes gene_type:complete
MADELDLVTMRRNAAAKAFPPEQEEGTDAPMGTTGSDVESVMNLVGGEPISQEEMDARIRVSDKLDRGEELTSDEEAFMVGPEEFPPTEEELAAQRAEQDFQDWAVEMSLDASLPETRQKYDRQNELRAMEARLEGSEIYPNRMSSTADMNMRREGYDVKSRPHDQDFYNEPHMRLGKNRPSQPPVPQSQTRVGPGITLGSARERFPESDDPAALRKAAAEDNAPQEEPPPWARRGMFGR